jgi:prepilin-type N-terminal cleavage/methylation domain-containing protein
MRRAPAAGRTRQAQGFTLLELMIAMSVIAIALFGILAMITQIMTMRDVNRESEAAKEWVQQEVEKVKSYPFASVNAAGAYLANTGTTYVGTAVNFATPPTSPIPAPTAPLAAPPAQLASATGVVKVDYTNASLYEIVVTVNWKARKGTGAYVMRSLYSQPGP